jgi:hypothetical protein
MNTTQQTAAAAEAAKQAVIAQLVKQNVAVVDKMNGLGWNCLCCIGC